MSKALIMFTICIGIVFGCDSTDDTSDSEAAEAYDTRTSFDTRCEAVTASVDDAGFTSVAVTCDDNYAYITSDTYPDHDLMNGITGTNEQIPVPAKDYSAPIKLSPEGTSNLTTIDAALGVAVNGVPIYDYSAAGELDVETYDEAVDTTLLGQLDNCGGHAGRGDDYHYHASPTCMIENMSNSGDSAVIGWAYDGYPIYGNNNPDGSTITTGELDTCNGKSDEIYGYRYHTSEVAPYILQCLRGEIDDSVLPRVAPMQGRTDGRPPEGGVTNLTHTISNGGTRLEYTYQNQTYYLQYSESDTANCYDFETRTVTNNGEVVVGEYCRE
ncbi:YHYH protein [Pseudobacteriovorax antillogorgiicola]|uniref:YHYH protein n=1 Tax=Pseudobacteriovorax antillogorgiicola TaxID=1513793 RepID=A0A1Y6BEX3_9BACT|nr:YHYH protein [Pseudobacteriovorax antillogorgiicola]TCS57484.1 YHYH protein [Pseudobacteriovorax antillogorgiicola]SMF00526.1 YHYH protein [Pseudobacteriovorax antillogorgiicola]